MCCRSTVAHASGGETLQAEWTLVHASGRNFTVSPVRRYRKRENGKCIWGGERTLLKNFWKMALHKRVCVVLLEMVFKFSLRIVSMSFVSRGLASPDNGMLPLHVTQPLFGRLEEGIAFTFLKKTYVWVDILQDVPPELGIWLVES